MGTNDQSKVGELLNKFDISGIKQDSFQYYCFDIQGAGFFPMAGIFMTHLVYENRNRNLLYGWTVNFS